MVQPSHGSSEGKPGEEKTGSHSSAPTGASAAGGSGAAPHANGSTTGQQHEASADQANAPIDFGKAKAADTLRDVAQKVRERGGSAPVPGIDRAANFSARQVETGAQYLEAHSASDMWGDLMRFCKAHPAGALVLGFGLGYFVKKLMP